MMQKSFVSCHPQMNHDQVAFQRRFVSYIKRCDELERKLRYIKGELNKFGLNTEVRIPSLSIGGGLWLRVYFPCPLVRVVTDY